MGQSEVLQQLNELNDSLDILQLGMDRTLRVLKGVVTQSDPDEPRVLAIARIRNNRLLDGIMGAETGRSLWDEAIDGPRDQF